MVRRGRWSRGRSRGWFESYELFTYIYAGSFEQLIFTARCFKKAVISLLRLFSLPYFLVRLI